MRHNIDVMHVEKNVSDALLSLLMHSVKSKDGLKARKDLEDIGFEATYTQRTVVRELTCPLLHIGFLRKRNESTTKG